jgi:hypothetical protein
MKKIRWISTLLVLGAAIFLKGCGIFSLHPLYTEEDVVFLPELIGTWKSPESQNDDFFVFNQYADNKYHFQMIDEGDTIDYELHLLKLGRYYYMDYYPLDEEYMIEQMFRNYIPVHTFSRIDFTDEGISIIEFDQERLSDLFKQNRIRLAHEKMPDIDDDMIVITAQTQDIQKFIIKYSDDEQVFDSPEPLVKISG